MQKIRYIFIISVIIMLSSCKKNDKTELANVYGKKLYLEDIKDIIPENASKEDSLMILRSKVNLWTRKQALLKKAETDLNEEQKDINYIVEEYRESLLIEKYKQEYIKQYLDTNISETEIEKYYNEYPESFILNNDIVKAYFFKFNAEKNTDEFNKYFLSKDAETVKDMIKFAEKNAEEYINFTDKWTDLSVISNLLPVSLINAENLINKNKKIQTRDEKYKYYVFFTDVRIKGQKMPFEFVKEKIKIILLNKRKANLINKLEDKIFDNAVKNGKIKIYTD